MNAEVPESWAGEAEALLHDFTAGHGAALERRQLTELLVGFQIVPATSTAASVWVIVSPNEVVVEAGRAARFELDALPASSAELKDILDAIAGGRLDERAGWFGVKFKLDLLSGRSLTGRVLGRGIQRGTLHYQPYDSQPPDISEPSQS